jgi:hypothetical protein
MSDINIKVDQSIIRTNLTNMIVHPNEKAIVNLIAAMLEENHQASTLFVEYLLGKSEVILPTVGTVGRFNISRVWVSDKALLESSEYNLNGYVTCIVTECLSLHNYNQLKVDFPTVNSNGKKITASTGLELKQFLIDDNDFGDPPF